MSVKRLVRYFVALIISFVLVYVGAPLVGIPKSHLLPPTAVYKSATGTTTGIVTAYRYSVTNNPFYVGDKIWFVDYKFRAPDPAAVKLGAAKPNMVVYTGSFRQPTKLEIRVGSKLPIRYETTYPDVNGVDVPREGGVGCGEGSNILSGWLIWLTGTFVLAFGVMMIIERFQNVEDI